MDERNKKIFYCLIGKLQSPAFHVLYLCSYFHRYKWELCICSEGSIDPKAIWDNYMSGGILIYKDLLLNPVARGSRKVTLTLVKYGKHIQKAHSNLPGKKKAGGSFTVKFGNRCGNREILK